MTGRERSIIERSISYVLIGMILLFAITSTGNVTEYVHTYHKGWTGITLGLSFGITVFTCAYIAATAQRSATRFSAIAIGSIFGIASATFQMNIYILGGAEWSVAAALSYIPIVAGEVGLAILEHFYSTDSIAHSSKVERVAAERVRVVKPTIERSSAQPIERAIEQVQNIQLPEPKSEKPSTEKIEPRNERESEFWQMLSSDAQYKITALAKEWGVAPNTLRNWKERWNSANLNSQMQMQSGD